MVTTSISVGQATSHDAAAWDAFVQSQRASGYHRWAWRSIFERAFGHDTSYLIARDRDRVVGVLPLVILRSVLFGNFAVSLPFVNYGGVVATRDDAARALLEHSSQLAQQERLAHIELRHSAALFPDLPAKRHKVGMLMNLAATEELAWQALDRKVRNQIRKAEKSNLTVRSGGPELLDDFYTIFARNMRDLGTPVYDRRFFAEMFREFPADTRVFLVSHESKPIAAGISYHHGHTVEVPSASSLKEYLSLCPNNLLYWSVIKYAIEQGATVFDFGRSTPHEGTYKFKQQWGAEPQPLCWEYRLLAGTQLPDQSPKNPKFRAAIAIWKRLPLGLTTYIGPRVVRAIP